MKLEKEYLQWILSCRTFESLSKIFIFAVKTVERKAVRDEDDAHARVLEQLMIKSFFLAVRLKYDHTEEEGRKDSFEAWSMRISRMKELKGMNGSYLKIGWDHWRIHEECVDIFCIDEKNPWRDDHESYFRLDMTFDQ